MDWTGNLRMPFVSRADHNSFNFLYNNYNYDHFPEMKQPSFQASTTLMPAFIDKNNNNNNNNYYDPKKKRLSNEQLESLENSFQEEIKLEPDRKMKLAKELGLQPRQIAVWFQNRKARWKGKQLESLYDALKQEYDAVSRDKHKLQQEVMALRTILKEQVVGKKQVVSTGHTEISGEETVESTSSGKASPTTTNNVSNQMAECSYHVLNLDDYNPVMMPPPPYWPAMP